VARDGSIWIPEFNTGFLTRFDPQTEKFERYSLGDTALGAYDVVIDDRQNAVWITGSLASSLLRFDMKTRQIEKYPLPTEPAYMRHIQVDPKTGDVWSAYSSLPTAVPKVVRLTRKR
jgi:streptogramin lyase